MEETDQGCDRNAIRSTAIQVLEMADACQADDGVDKVGLLGPAVHEVGVRDLDGPREPMV